MTSGLGAERVLARAREIAESVFFPATIAVDAADRIPASHLDLLAADGFYGMAAPTEFGGPDVDFPTACAILETFASACLATTFVWMQHHGVVLRVAYGDTELREKWLSRLVSGEVRAGVALGGTLPGPPKLTARPVDGGYVLNGHSPWVTGWGMVDVLTVAARDGDRLVWALVDAEANAGLTVEPLPMVAVNASNTVTARFDDFRVPAERVISVQDYAEWQRGDSAGLRMNGSLALGLTARCATLLGPSGLDAELTRCRSTLDAADADGLPAARAAASALAVKAANLLVASTGSRAVLAGEHAQKLAREALFLLVFGSRPGVKQELIARLS